ncbi:hypothetical protein KP509_04G070700 [Ceratopteris richardii]|uniref:GATA-type domain-containing protein n=1 Tax=Ceratopteris richardii TaxID=49495 RepID=A0A8T2V5V8_CERRI|nr:hypothetical protein KP509_04G070700 [Ceratopteris richardii]
MMTAAQPMNLIHADVELALNSVSRQLSLPDYGQQFHHHPGDTANPISSDKRAPADTNDEQSDPFQTRTPCLQTRMAGITHSSTSELTSLNSEAQISREEAVDCTLALGLRQQTQHRKLCNPSFDLSTEKFNNAPRSFEFNPQASICHLTRSPDDDHHHQHHSHTRAPNEHKWLRNYYSPAGGILMKQEMLPQNETRIEPEVDLTFNNSAAISYNEDSASHHSARATMNAINGRRQQCNVLPGGRICSRCKTRKTPLWRNGPKGPKSLCNACGIRFKKEERRYSSTNHSVRHHLQAHSAQLMNLYFLTAGSCPYCCCCLFS